MTSQIFALKTTANREDQVIDFIASNAKKKGLGIYALFNAHGMRGYVFLEAASEEEARTATTGVPYARGLLPKPLEYSEVAPMLEQVKQQLNMQERDIVEVISGPFKGEKAMIKRLDEQKEEVVVELLEAAIPIPITVKMDSVKVIRRDSTTTSASA